MYVKNVAGYNFAFKYNGINVNIPYDNIIYSIPDDINVLGFKELKVILPMHVRTQKVLYINKLGKISDINGGHKRRGRPVKKKKKTTEQKNKFVIDINLSATEDEVVKKKRKIKLPKDGLRRRGRPPKKKK
jgi:hypothetical protein